MLEDRQGLRKRILGSRDRLSSNEKHEKSLAVMDNFWSLWDMHRWSTLFMYVNFRSEVETLDLVRVCIGMTK